MGKGQPETGIHEHMSHQNRVAKLEAGKKKEQLLNELEDCKDMLTLKEDERFKKLCRSWAEHCNIAQGKMFMTMDPNEMFSHRGVFKAYTLVLDWKTDLQNRIKEIRKQINAQDNILNPVETEDRVSGVMDMSNNKPAG